MSAVSWTDNDGKLWMFGGIGITGSQNDLWKFDPSTGEWTWMAGNSTLAYNPLTGSGQPGVYGTLGTPAPGNTPGSRFDALGWTDSKGNLWLFGGYGFDANGAVDFLNDLWKFNPATNEWTWMGGDSTLPCLAINQCYIRPGVYGTLGIPGPGNAPGGRSRAATWTDRDGNLWLYGGHGADYKGIQCYLDDLWEFNPTLDEWKWNGGAQNCLYFDTGYEGVYATPGTPSGEAIPWSLTSAATWTDSSGNLWLFGGKGVDPNGVGWDLNDIWDFNPSSNEWTWASAYSSTSGSYGSIGDWSPANFPGARYASAHWTDSNGNFWLLGGEGVSPSSTALSGMFNDLWEFKPSINEWAWMGGNNDVACLKWNSGICGSWGQPGVYGALGTPASGNVPGARYFGVSWTDNSGNLWLFGGYGIDAQGNGGYLNDLWQYSLKTSPATSPAPSAATPSFSLVPGSYAVAQTLTISDQTPGAAVYYTTDGTMPSGSSNVYTGPITVSSPETVAAIAVASGYSVSSLATATYTVNVPQAAAPSFSLPAGSYASVQTVAISDATPGAVIYFTTDGTTPTTNSTVYSGTITVSSTQTIKAVAVATGYSNSVVASSTYTINLPPNFSLSASPGSLTVFSGGQAAATITVNPQNGFNMPVSFACSGLPSGVRCSFLPVTVTPSGAAVTTVLTIAASAVAKSERTRGGPLYPVISLSAGALFILRKKRAFPVLCLIAVTFLGIGVIEACGGPGNSAGGGGGGKPPMTSVVTVTATSGVLQQTTTVSLTLN